MVTGQEGGVAQTRAGIIEIMWKSALTAGAAQALTVSSAFAADVSDDTGQNRMMSYVDYRLHSDMQSPT